MDGVVVSCFVTCTMYLVSIVLICPLAKFYGTGSPFGKTEENADKKMWSGFIRAMLGGGGGNHLLLRSLGASSGKF